MRGLLACLLLSALARAWADAAAAAGSPASSIPEVLFRRERAWSDVAQPLAALRLAQPPSSLHYVPGWRDTSPPRFLLVGDASGGILVLSPAGNVLAQHATGTDSPVTALGSYLLGRNATVLLSGHASGELRLHLLQHPPAPSGGGQEGWEDAEDEWQEAAAAAAAGTRNSTVLRLSLLDALPPEALLCGCSGGGGPGTCAAAGREAAAVGGTAEAAAAAAAAAANSLSHCAPIATVHGSGRGGNVASTAVVINAAGALAVLKHGGLANQGVRVVRHSLLEQQPVALRLPPMATVAAVLGSSGVAAQRLGPAPAAAKAESGATGQAGASRAPTQPAAGAEASPPGLEAGPTFRPCSSLNGSAIVAGAFDALHGSRAYAVGDDGRLFALVVGGGDRGSPAGCTARTSVPLHAALVQAAKLAGSAGSGSSATSSSGSSSSSNSRGSLLPGTVNVATLPGYLLVTAGDWLALYNVSSAPRRAPRLLLVQHLPPLLRQLSSAGSAAHEGQQRRQQGRAGQAGAASEPAERDGWAAAPLLAAGHGRVALMLEPRVLALFETSLPYRPPPQPYRGSLAWMQLFQPAAMVMVAAFVLQRARSKRGGGGGGGGGRACGGAVSGGDPRLREFERLLQDPMAGATAPHRQRPSWLRSDRAGASSDSSGSDVEDSLLGTLPSSTRSGSAGDAMHAEPAAHRRGGLFGPRPTSSTGGADGRARQAQRQRAAALAAEDDAAIRALRAELAHSRLRGAEMAGDVADVDMTEQAPAELGDEVSVLRRRLNQAHL